MNNHVLLVSGKAGEGKQTLGSMSIGCPGPLDQTMSDPRNRLLPPSLHGHNIRRERCASISSEGAQEWPAISAKVMTGRWAGGRMDSRSLLMTVLCCATSEQPLQKPP